MYSQGILYIQISHPKKENAVTSTSSQSLKNHYRKETKANTEKQMPSWIKKRAKNKNKKYIKKEAIFSVEVNISEYQLVVEATSDVGVFHPRQSMPS